MKACILRQNKYRLTCNSILTVVILSFCNHCVVDVHSFYQGMPQYVAAEEGQTDVLEYLVDSGAGINITDGTGVCSASFPLLMLV